MDPKTRGSPHAARAITLIKSLSEADGVSDEEKAALVAQMEKIQKLAELPNNGGTDQLALMFPCCRVARTFKGDFHKLQIVFGAESEFEDNFKTMFLSAMEDLEIQRRGGRPQRSIANQRVREMLGRR